MRKMDSVKPLPINVVENLVNTNFEQVRKLISQSRCTEAHKEAREALEIFHQVYGSNHTETVKCKQIISQINFCETKNEKFLKAQRKLKSDLESPNGISIPQKISDMLDFASDLKRGNNFERAYTAYSIILEMIEQLTIESSHPNEIPKTCDVTKVFEELSYLYMVQGDYEKSVDLCKKLMDYRNRVRCNKFHPGVLPLAPRTAQAIDFFIKEEDARASELAKKVIEEYRESSLDLYDNINTRLAKMIQHLSTKQIEEKRKCGAGCGAKSEFSKHRVIKSKRHSTA